MKIVKRKKGGLLPWQAGCLVLLTWAGIGSVLGQTYDQVAPKQPPKQPPGKLDNLPPEEKARRGGKSHVVFIDQLRGVVFVRSAKEVRVDGVTEHMAINPGDVAFTQRGDFQMVIMPFIGQPVTMDSLDRLTSAVVQYYRKNDRPIVNVFVPQQNITRGFVQVVVVEGAVGEVGATGAKWFSNDDLRNELRLSPGDTISGSRLINDLDWLNRNPFRQSDVVFGPGSEPGLTDVTLKTKDRFPLRVYAGFDDTGNQYTGDNRYYAGFNYGNLFGLDQQFSYQFTMAEDTNELTAHSASYVIPLPWHHQLTFFGSYGEAHATIPGGIDTGGVNWQASMRYEVPLRSSANYKHSIITGFDFKQGNNNLAFGGTTVTNVYADVAQFVLGYQGTYLDPYGSTNGSVTAYLSPGGMTGGDNAAAYQAMRYDARPNYIYEQANLQRVTKLPCNFTLINRGFAQYSNTNLLASEQLGLGGFDTVRGYDEREVNGDKGFLISTELATPPFSIGNLFGLAQATDEFQALGFIDYGGSSLHNAGPNDTKPNSNLLGVGPGVRYAISPYMSFRFDYGFQLIKTGFDNRHDSRCHFGLVLSY